MAFVACNKPPAVNRSPTNGSTEPPAPVGQSSGSLPPIASESGAPGQAPVVWVGGTLASLTDRQLVLKEAFGSKVDLKRLGQDATAFLRAIGGTWVRVDPAADVVRGERACVETLLDGENLLALRVFLGTDCGPVA